MSNDDYYTTQELVDKFHEEGTGIDRDQLEEVLTDLESRGVVKRVGTRDGDDQWDVMNIGVAIRFMLEHRTKQTLETYKERFLSDP